MFWFFQHLCLFAVKVYSITKDGNDWTVCSCFFLFSKKVSQKKTILTSSPLSYHQYGGFYWITDLWNYHCLLCNTVVYFAGIIHGPVHFVFKSSSWLKKQMKNVWHYCWMEQNFEYMNILILQLCLNLNLFMGIF